MFDYTATQRIWMVNTDPDNIQIIEMQSGQVLSAREGSTFRPFVSFKMAYLAAKAIDPEWKGPFDNELIEAQFEAEDTVRTYINDFAKRFTDPYPVGEVARWSDKERIAQLHANGTPQDEIIEEATAGGIEPDDLAQIILEKATLYKAVLAKIAGLRKSTLIAIENTTDVDEIMPIMMEAMEIAEAYAAELGV